MHFVDAKSILSAQNGMNLYRGCTHGCIYCDSRSRCYGFTHPFEDVEVKRNAPELLEQALRARRRPCMIGTGSMCDPYLPLEAELGLTRRCLEVLYRHGFGVSLLTKSTLVLRDRELLRAIHERARCVVQMTLTTWDESLCRIVEPGVASTRQRLEALAALREDGIPTMVWLSPILPFLNDTEENLRALLDACVSVGVQGIVCFGMGLTLREGNREYFYAALDRHFPGLKERYIRTYGNAYLLPSPREAELMALFRETCQANGLLYEPEECFAWLRQLPDKYEQTSLF